MTFGMGLRMGGQVAVFLIVARFLGVDGYGAYAAALALASVFGNLAGFGANALLVRDVARSSEAFPEAWGSTLMAIGVSLPPLFLLYLGLAWAALPGEVSLIPIVAIGLAEVVFAPLMFSSVAAFQAHERMRRAAWLVVAPVLPRLAGAVLLLILAPATSPGWRLALWAIVYAGAGLLAVVYGFALVRQTFGRGVFGQWSATLALWREGYPFSLGGMALRLYTEIDKTMLARFASLEAAGLYSAGYRAVDLANVPLRALLTAVMPRLFRAGERGGRATLGYALRVAPVPLIYAAGIGGVMYLMAEGLPWLLGEGYRESAQVIRYLALLPLIAAPRMLFQSALGGSGRQVAAVTILVVGALVNIMLNLWLIPRWGWRGALGATYGVELVMMMAMAATLWRGARGESN